MEAARTLKANLKLDGKPCGWCQVALRLGEDATVCNACEKEHHSRCWDGNAGCSTSGCVSAPLRRLDMPLAGGGASSPYAPQGAGIPYGTAASTPYGAPASQYGAASSPFGGPQVPAGYMSCPSCRSSIMIGSPICPICRAITSPDGIYHGPKMNAPGAVASLVLGIVGFFICGIIFGIIAISQANSAKRAIAADPTLGGEGYATAGLVLGIIQIIVHGLVVIISLANSGSSHGY